MTTDELIDRLRERAQDPSRRIDATASEFDAAVAGMELTDLVGMLENVAGDLAHVVAANTSGQAIDPGVVARAEAAGSSMSTPAASVAREPVSVATFEREEARLGRRLPAFLRRVYTEVADGGVGPGSGLFALGALVDTYARTLADPPSPVGVSWPVGMVPLANDDPGFFVLELPQGRVLDWDPLETHEEQSAADWARSFEEIAPDTETWLSAWVDSVSPRDQREDAMTRLRREGMRETKARIAAMTPAEREAIGLPAVGWEAAYIDDADI